MKAKRALADRKGHSPGRKGPGETGAGRRSLLPPPLSPNRQLVLVVSWIFLAELINMALLSQIQVFSPVTEALLDSTFLLITLSPIYFLLFRPFKLQWDERLQMENRLRYNEERLELALEAANMGLWDYNTQTGEVYYSPRWATMLGYPPTEIEPHYRSWERLLHPDDKEQVLATLANHMEGRTPHYETETRMRSKSGQWLWILARGRIVSYDAKGRPLRMIGTHTDITARREAEEEIRYLSRQLLNVTEEERASLARDLHDELGQVLAALQFGMETLKNTLPEDLEKGRTQCEKQIDLVAQLGHQVRNISASLRPAILDDMGLGAALKCHVEQFSRYLKEVKVDLKVCCPDGGISKNARIVLFRICQESLNNIAKHSKAERVGILLTRTQTHIVLTIEDDGVGLEPGPNGHQGIGLLGMRERAASMGGRLTIHSSKGKGTKIEAELPISEEWSECRS